jgi:hypothetical protein
MKKLFIFICIMLFGFSNIAIAEADVLHACIKNNSGDMRVVGDPEQCSPSEENYVSWSIQGAKNDAVMREGGAMPTGLNNADRNYAFKGYTTATHKSAVTLLYYGTSICESEFGTGSRVSTSKEMREAADNGNLPLPKVQSGAIFIPAMNVQLPIRTPSPIDMYVLAIFGPDQVLRILPSGQFGSYQAASSLTPIVACSVKNI